MTAYWYCLFFVYDISLRVLSFMCTNISKDVHHTYNTSVSLTKIASTRRQQCKQHTVQPKGLNGIAVYASTAILPLIVR